jgi:arsenate reductase
MNPNKSRFTIMFLCTGNSARSIFADYPLKKIAPVRFETYSAGASPKPAPHPLALEILREDFKIDASDAYMCHSISSSPSVTTPGKPALFGRASRILAHWRRALWQVAQQIRRRLELLASLPFEKLDVLRLEAATKEIGVREKIQIGNQAPA